MIQAILSFLAVASNPYQMGAQGAQARHLRSSTTNNQANNAHDAFPATSHIIHGGPYGIVGSVNTNAAEETTAIWSQFDSMTDGNTNAVVSKFSADGTPITDVSIGLKPSNQSSVSWLSITGADSFTDLPTSMANISADSSFGSSTSPSMNSSTNVGTDHHMISFSQVTQIGDGSLNNSYYLASLGIQGDTVTSFAANEIVDSPLYSTKNIDGTYSVGSTACGVEAGNGEPCAAELITTDVHFKYASMIEFASPDAQLGLYHHVFGNLGQNVQEYNGTLFPSHIAGTYSSQDHPTAVFYAQPNVSGASQAMTVVDFDPDFISLGEIAINPSNKSDVGLVFPIANVNTGKFHNIALRFDNSGQIMGPARQLSIPSNDLFKLDSMFDHPQTGKLIGHFWMSEGLSSGSPSHKSVFVPLADMFSNDLVTGYAFNENIFFNVDILSNGAIRGSGSRVDFSNENLVMDPRILEFFNFESQSCTGVDVIEIGLQATDANITFEHVPMTWAFSFLNFGENDNATDVFEVIEKTFSHNQTCGGGNHNGYVGSQTTGANGLANTGANTLTTASAAELNSSKENTIDRAHENDGQTTTPPEDNTSLFTAVGVVCGILFVLFIVCTAVAITYSRKKRYS